MLGHASVVLDMKLKGSINQSPLWRTLLLLKIIPLHLIFYNEFINLQSTDNPSLLWETCKAYARELRQEAPKFVKTSL